MSIVEKLKKISFWINVLKVAVPFFLMVVIVTLIIASSKDIFSGNWEAVNEVNFSNGKWVRFFSVKGVISFVYGIYQAMKHTK